MSDRKNQDEDLTPFERALASLGPRADGLDGRWLAVSAETARQAAAVDAASQGPGQPACESPAGHQFVCLHCGRAGPSDSGASTPTAARSRMGRWAWPAAAAVMTGVAAVLLAMLVHTGSQVVAHRAERDKSPPPESKIVKDNAEAQIALGRSIRARQRPFATRDCPGECLGIRRRIAAVVRSWSGPCKLFKLAKAIALARRGLDRTACLAAPHARESHGTAADLSRRVGTLVEAVGHGRLVRAAGCQPAIPVFGDTGPLATCPTRNRIEREPHHANQRLDVTGICGHPRGDGGLRRRPIVGHVAECTGGNSRGGDTAGGGAAGSDRVVPGGRAAAIAEVPASAAACRTSSRQRGGLVEPHWLEWQREVLTFGDPENNDRGLGADAARDPRGNRVPQDESGPLWGLLSSSPVFSGYGSRRTI